MVAALDIIIIAIFFIVIFYLGIRERKKLSLDDYWVNSRKTNKFVLIATVMSSFLGAGAIFANSSLAYSGAGFATFVIPISFTLFFIIFAKFFAPKIKEFGDKYKAYSMPDFLEHRYSAKTRFAGATTILVTWLLFLALQMLAFGMLFSSLAGFNPTLATIIGGVIVITYTTIGGLRADIRTDVFQSIVMLFLLTIFLPLFIIKAGGFGAVSSLSTSFLSGTEFAPPYVIVLALLFLGVGAITSAELWQRAYASDTKKNVKWAFTIASILVFAFLVMAVLIGVYGKVLLPGIDPNLIIPESLRLVLPVGLFGLAIAGFLAAIMSTTDTELLLLSMTIVHDFYQRSRKKKLAPEKVLKLTRIVTLVLGVLSLIWALIVFNIIHLAIEAVSFYAVLLPAIVFGFYWKKATAKAAFWSIVIGFITLVVFLFIDPIQAFIPGIIASFIAFFVVQAITRKKDKL